jgi:biopolymer transport protein ExbB
MQSRRLLSIRPSRLLCVGIVCAAVLCAAVLCGPAQAQTPGTAAAPTGITAPVVGAPSDAASSGAAQQSAAAPNATGADAANAAAPQPPQVTDIASALLPHDLTPWGMFRSADIVVKAVMIGLVLASVLTWTIWLAKTLELVGARRRLARAHEALESARTLAEAAQSASAASPQVARLIGAVETELHRAPDLRDIDGIKERIAARFERIEAGVGRQMLRGTSILATIGATAPFVGLFGTVWGIMNSFIGISKLHTTNLAVVAPGIAEALLATAFGLVAAIPAVVIYNMFSRSIAQYRALYADTSVEIMTLVSRDLVHRPERYLAAVPAAE